MSHKRIAFANIDLDKPGRSVGFIMIPHSPHDDAWGVTRVPIAVIANGRGPTVIIEGGNHGDEYEGPIVIGDLIRDIDVGKVQGRLILLPAVNVHAVTAGRRTSPVDGLNFNRVFPGNASGTITQQIAEFVASEIMPLGQAFLDLHSGGSSLNFLPSAVLEPVTSEVHHRRNVEMVQAFGAPIAVVVSNHGDSRTATATACRAGLTTMGTEMGGGGTVSIDAISICRRGVRGVLSHLGVLPADADVATPMPAPLYELKRNSFIYASSDGIFEPFHPNGAIVHMGEPAGRIHQTWDAFQTPEVLHYAADGLLYGRRQPGRVRPGNCCLVVASPLKPS
ncbi:MAG TPA: succinylglutamate desuccinylase/aspartoacylase family protein [Nitrospiraceae bacterium]|nr:succinylglutamate desuccinylase/aspartoacylase family protein [Nitrospiraceae bacterium]